MNYQRYIRHFDFVSFSLMLLMLTIGLLFVFSSTYQPTVPYSFFLKKQLIGAATGLLLYFLFCFKDLRNFTQMSYFFFYGILLLLVYTIFAGWLGMGAKRWISLYFFRFQPSELTKLFLPAFIAESFRSKSPLRLQQTQTVPLQTFIEPLVVLASSFLLIRKQPDLGTGLIILFSGLILLWFIGMNKKFFITSGIIILLGAPLLWTFLKPYQQRRIKVLFGYGDIKRERYHIEQSKIAIGSGGLKGKGFLKGTQNKLQFLPEDHTDFIFSVICEEWGFIGSLLVIIIFSLLFCRILLFVPLLTSLYDQIIVVGLVIHLLLSSCVNIGMVIGLLPVVGIPLPFFSYGITNLWISMMSLGWIHNIIMRRFYI